MISERSTGAALPAGSRPLLVCLSHLRWNFVYQRPQHVLSRAARHFDILYVEEPLDSADHAPDWVFTDAGVADGQIRVATPLISHGLAHAARVDLLETMLRRLVAGRPIAVGWFYTPMALEYARGLNPAVIVYDNMDELSLFHGADSRMLLLENELLARADIVFTGGHSLYEAKRSRHANIHPVPSSVDKKHFERSIETVTHQAYQRTTASCVGFFGVIDERMDMALVDAVAALRPDLEFQMVGPIVKIDPGTRSVRPNIKWLGGRDYADLPAILHGWTCGFMPFARNDATRFISPTKTPEFLAAGLPVVSTAIRDVVRPYGELGLVRIADTPETFAAAIDLAIGDAATARWRRDVAAHLATMSWDHTWAFMFDQIEALGTPAREIQHA